MLFLDFHRNLTMHFIYKIWSLLCSIDTAVSIRYLRPFQWGAWFHEVTILILIDGDTFLLSFSLYVVPIPICYQYSLKLIRGVCSLFPMCILFFQHTLACKKLNSSAFNFIESFNHFLSVFLFSLDFETNLNSGRKHFANVAFVWHLESVSDSSPNEHACLHQVLSFTI